MALIAIAERRLIMSTRYKKPTGQQPTQESVVNILLKTGPLSARDIAIRLTMSPAGVRRHLEHLCETGEAEEVTTSSVVRKNRGRPARQFQLTRLGRERFGNDYEDLAKDALSELRHIAGDTAILHFAHHRMSSIFEGIEPVSNDLDTQEHTLARMQVLDTIVNRFIQAGFSTTVEHVGNGVQLCQHHCPVAAVAETCPELCMVEEEEIERLLGIHVQRLSALSHGHRTCTTNIPLSRDSLLKKRNRSSITMDRRTSSLMEKVEETEPHRSLNMTSKKGFANDSDR